MHKNKEICLGDPKVFSSQYELYFSTLKYFGLKYINDEDIVCDTIQEIFLKLWNTKQEFKNELSLRAFLYTSTKNAILNKIRDDNTHKRIENKILLLEDTEESFLSKIIEAELFEIIKHGFENLPKSVKKVYRMSLNGMSHAEIADVLKISINTIKKHKNTANHILRKKLKDILSLIILIS